MTAVETDVTNHEIHLLLEDIYLRYGADFREYSPTSVRRRVTLAVTQLGYAGIPELRNQILADAKNYTQLLDFLTVPTSEMFRDPSYFRALRENVVPLLRTYPSIKIWVAGCSRGEELYSLAILLREEGILEKTVIYATDINPLSLERAKSGIFPLDLASKYTENYQKSGGKSAFSDYYQAGYGSIIFDASLRANVVFADHSLATDSVFTGSLVYLAAAVLAVPIARFLGLGSKETLRFSPLYEEFEEFVREDRIYRKRRSR